MLYINGSNLTLEKLILVARNNARVGISPSAKKRVNEARAYVEEKISQGAVIYGLTTGFGKFSDVHIPNEDTALLQRNLIISHACAMGNPLSTECVRAAMLLRCNALCRGNSGIRLSTIETLIAMLNKGVHPIVPEKGSLGASGDLAPLAHIALVLIGEGEAEYRGKRMSGAEAMKRAGITPVELAAKEGLALINGTQIMTAIGALAAYDARELCKVADVAAALSGEALSAITAAYDKKVQLVRGHKGQCDCAENLLALLNGSGFAAQAQPGRVQDAYALRCTPQVHGASRDAIAYVCSAVEVEMNAVTDNPLIFPNEDQVISGGNFHGQPMALAFDFLAIAISELADISERRLERLVNPQLNGELPAFLANNGGVESGYMITQYAAASMVSENKIYAHPASVDSIPSSGNQEDHVSMGTTAARKAVMILDNSRKVIGIELLAAAQATQMRDLEKASPASKAVIAKIREKVPFMKNDCVMYPHMNSCEELVKSGAIISAVEATGVKIK